MFCANMTITTCLFCSVSLCFAVSYIRDITIAIHTNGHCWCMCHIPPRTNTVFSFFRFTDFKIAQLVKATEVEEMFVNSGLTLEYETHVSPLMKRQ